MIYLNNAATTYPKPDCVLRALSESAAAPPPAQYRGASGGFAGADVFQACREKLGRLLGISETDRIFFTSGATEAANAVLSGLPIGEGKVLVTQTEHNCILRPLNNLPAFRGKNRMQTVPCGADGRVDPGEAERCVTKDTAALVVCHCSNVTGTVQDMAAFSRIAREHGLFLVADVSQSAGCLPVDADAWRADALIFTGHKSLFGVQGTGGFYIRRGIPLVPFKYGGTGRNSSRLLFSEENWEYEPGTQNSPGIAALDAGVGFVLETGLPGIMEREKKLMEQLRGGLRRIPSVTLYGGPGENGGPVVSFRVKGFAPGDVAYLLAAEYGVTVRAGLHCAPLIHRALGTEDGGTVRAGISYLTGEEEIRAFLNAMEEICASGVSE